MSYLPQAFRPNGLPHKEFRPGDDLPEGFHYHLKALDPDLYCVWHPYKCLFDDVMNIYYGRLEDPRYQIHESFGQEVWGWVMTDNTGSPLYDEKWHVWRAHQYGYSHIIGIESKEPQYLDKVLESIWEQKLVEKYGRKAVIRMKEAKAEAAMEKKAQQKAQAFEDLQKENKSMFRKVMENFDRGYVKPTGQTVDVITSYGGQGNRSRITRPSTDEDGGIVGWDGKPARNVR